MKKILGLAFIALGIFLEVMWLGFCFGSIVIGILLLIFAPRILFFPFTFFLLVGMRLIYTEAFKNFENASKNGHYNREYSNFSNNQSGVNNTVSQIQSYYEELESSPSDSFDIIKKNYRRLMKEYHYDSIISKGLPQDMLDFSQEKTKSLNEAYAAIKEVRG